MSADIRDARRWLDTGSGLPHEATCLRGLDALDARATLESCDRARRAAEEECARLRGVVDDSDLRAIAAHNDVVALCADRDRLAADNAELEAALAAQREALKSCVDGENRLAALVARVRALVDSGHGVDTDVSLVAVSRALEGEVK